MTTVWLVTAGDYDMCYHIGVFTTQELAQAALEEAKQSRIAVGYGITEIEVDKAEMKGGW